MLQLLHAKEFLAGSKVPDKARMRQKFLKWWKMKKIQNIKKTENSNKKNRIKSSASRALSQVQFAPCAAEIFWSGSALVDAFGLLLVDCCCCRGRRLETRWHRDAELVEPVAAGRTRCRSRPEPVEGQVAHVGALFAVEPVRRGKVDL